MGKANAVEVVWVVLILTTAILSVQSFLSPEWVERIDGDMTCGLIRFCNNSNKTSCDNFGDSIDDVPGSYWRGAAGTSTFGVAVAVCTAITSISIFWSETSMTIVYYSNWVVAFLLFASTVLVLAGFNDMATPLVTTAATTATTATPNNTGSTTIATTGSTATTTTSTASTVGPPESCAFCGEGTTLFVLTDCTIGMGFILALASLASSLGACGVGKFLVLPFDFALP